MFSPELYKELQNAKKEGSVAKLSTRYEINVQISESKIIRMKVDYSNTVMQLKKIIFKIIIFTDG